MHQNYSDEKTGISYTLVGDYYLPDLTAPDGDSEIGRFGRMHLRFLKEHKRVAYLELFSSGRLNAYLRDIDIPAQEMFDRLVKEYAEHQGVTEQLKADNQMEWVGRMNNIRNAVQEVVLAEIVYL